jgi:hypothetical protein
MADSVKVKVWIDLASTVTAMAAGAHREHEGSAQRAVCSRVSTWLHRSKGAFDADRDATP